MKKATLLVALIALAGTLAFANGTKEMTPAPTGQTVAAPAKGEKEAPMLAKQVAAGTLPKLEERLPVASDVMVETMDSVGTYSDYFTYLFKGKDDQWTVGKMTEESLFRFKADGTVEPNVAKGYEVNSDATIYTIHLRKGMKWSDGVPFTSEDCIFFYEHMCKPKSFGKSLWDCWYSIDPVTKEKTPCTMEKVDDYTYKVIFKNPAPNFLEMLAINGKWAFAPAHWHKQILPEFIGKDAADAKAKEMGYKDAAAMGKETGYYYWNVVGRPTLRPWVAKNAITSDLLIYERNPYYWKTDKDGKQLPYFDEIHFEKFSDPNQLLLKTLSGENDINISISYTDLATLKQNQGKGGYSIYSWGNTTWSSGCASLQLNLTTPDDKIRALYQNIDFRHALSIAVDRTEVSALVTDGFSEPLQASPAKGALGYSEEWAKKWTEYDPEGARKLLEKCGLVMGSDGYYQFADGTPFILDILSHDNTSATSKVAELLTEKYYKAAGIKATFSLRDRSLVENMLINNEVQAILNPVSPMETVSIILRPDTLVPVRNYSAWYGTYGDWYVSGGKKGMEPTGDVKTLLSLYDELLATSDKAKQVTIAEKMLKLHQENVWQIGYFKDAPTLMVVKSDLKNFPKTSIYCDEFRGLGIAHLQNLYRAK